MTTIAQIITDAYRESNLLAISASPTTLEVAEALRLLNRFIPSLIGSELGELLQPVSYGDNNVERTCPSSYFEDLIDSGFVPVNSRLILNLDSAKEVYLHPNPMDGARFGISDASNNLATNTLAVSGNGRTIEDTTSLTLDVNGLDREWFYRADLADWKRVTNLEEDDDLPFPVEFDDLVVIGLARRLNPRHGQVADEQTTTDYSKLLKKFRARYRQSVEVSSEYFLTKFTGRNQLLRDDGYSFSGSFEKGRNLW